MKGDGRAESHVPCDGDPMILAGVDIGTLTCRLLIGQLSSSGNLTELHSDRRILRLGEGVDRSGRLLPAAMDRVVGTLKQWRQMISRYEAIKEAAVATSAVRDADNRDEFLVRVKQDTGFEIEVLSGDEEARRTMLGIRSGLPLGTTDVVAIDIGGGSTELILDRQGQPPIVRSLQVGVVRLTERCLRHDPPTAVEAEQARALVRTHLDALVSRIGPTHHLPCVGTAGTITTLAAMVQRLTRYTRTRIHHFTLTRQAIAELEAELLSRSETQRQGLPGLEAGREGVIVAGVLILSTVLDVLGREECLVSDLGLREGLLLDLAARL